MYENIRVPPPPLGGQGGLVGRFRLLIYKIRVLQLIQMTNKQHARIQEFSSGMVQAYPTKKINKKKPLTTFYSFTEWVQWFI